MMGVHQPQKELFAYRVDLDRRIPSDHVLRRVEGLIDFAFARSTVAHRYGYNG